MGKILRKVGGYQLNEGNLMAKGLYNITDDKDNVSFWFGEDEVDELLSCCDDDFIIKANDLLELSKTL